MSQQPSSRSVIRTTVIREVGMFLRLHRQHLEVSIQELAHQLNLTVAQLEAIEEGRGCLTPLQIYRAARFLDVSIASLFKPPADVEVRT